MKLKTYKIYSIFHDFLKCNYFEDIQILSQYFHTPLQAEQK